MEHKLNDELKLAGSKAQYDAHAKALLALKEVLAQILIGVTAEFQGMSPQDVIPYIEGEAEVGTVSVLTGETNLLPVIKGTNLESEIAGEGKVTYDVRFYARDPRKNERIEILVDVEAQKENPIVEYAVQPKTLAGTVAEFGNYDLQTVVLIHLSKKLAGPEEGAGLLRYLGTLFSSELKPEEKIARIEKEYGMVGEKMEKEVLGMCNLSDLIWEDGIEQGIEQGIAQNKKEIARKMLQREVPDEEILEILGISAEELEKIKKTDKYE